MIEYSNDLLIQVRLPEKYLGFHIPRTRFLDGSQSIEEIKEYYSVTDFHIPCSKPLIRSLFLIIFVSIKSFQKSCDCSTMSYTLIKLQLVTIRPCRNHVEVPMLTTLGINHTV